MPTNRELVKAAIETGSLSNGGLLNPYQAKKFLKQTFEATNLGPLLRHEMRAETSGEIDKIGIASRILRKKTENVDDGYRAGVKSGKIEYATTPVRTPWEITEESLRQNIEGESFEATVTNLMTAQIGVDKEDLYLNGNETMPTFSTTDNYAKGDLVIKDNNLYEFTAAHSAGAWTGTDATQVGEQGDIDFLKVNDGFIKQIKKDGHVVDASSYSGMKLDLFYDAVKSMPNKYNNGKLKWIMSPKRSQEWALYLLNQVIEKGGIVPENMYTSPVKIPVVECPSMNDHEIILADPQNLIEVNTYKVKIRKTMEGKEALMLDKRFYVVHFDFDAIIEETDATAIITNLA